MVSAVARSARPPHAWREGSAAAQLLDASRAALVFTRPREPQEDFALPPPCAWNAISCRHETRQGYRAGQGPAGAADPSAHEVKSCLFGPTSAFLPRPEPLSRALPLSAAWVARASPCPPTSAAEEGLRVARGQGPAVLGPRSRSSLLLKLLKRVPKPLLLLPFRVNWRLHCSHVLVVQATKPLCLPLLPRENKTLRLFVLLLLTFNNHPQHSHCPFDHQQRPSSASLSICPHPQSSSAAQSARRQELCGRTTTANTFKPPSSTWFEQVRHIAFSSSANTLLTND